MATRDAGDLEVVYGRFDDPVAARALLARVVALGFVGTEVGLDACGRWKVSTRAVRLVRPRTGTCEEARRAGLSPKRRDGGLIDVGPTMPP